MKNIVLKILLISQIFLFKTVFWNIDRFEVSTNPTSWKVWETFDITIKALDKDWNVYKDYEWEILIFSQSDPEAEFPWVLSDNTYKFEKSDAWIVKFENSVKFSKNWIHDISVFDITNEEIFWETEVNINDWTPKNQTNEEIEIKSPESWTTLPTSTFKVNWTTKPNYKVRVSVNNEKNFETISNSDWIFEIEVKDIDSWENVIKAFILDADEKIIWTSKEIFITIEDQKPQLKSIKVTPGDEILTNSNVKVSVIATSWLSEASIIFNDSISKLKEVENWLYETTIMSPSEPWEYKIDVILKNEIWNEIKKNWAYILNVTEKELEAPKEIINETEEINCDDLQKELEIKNIKLTKLKSKSILSWDKVEKATSYNLYKKDSNSKMVLVQSVETNSVDIPISWNKIKNEDFAVKAVLKNEQCEIESKDFSEITTVQTWPKEFIILLIISFLIWFFILKRKNV